MVLPRRYRPSSEAREDTVYHDKWTRMLFRRSQRSPEPPSRQVFPGLKKMLRRQRPNLQQQQQQQNSGRFHVVPLSPASSTTTSGSGDLDDDTEDTILVESSPPSSPKKSRRQEDATTATARSRSIPPIATIADLAPKVLNQPQLAVEEASSSNHRRRSSTALPDWWKRECAAALKKEDELTRATWHGTKKVSSLAWLASERRRSSTVSFASDAGLPAPPSQDVLSLPVAQESLKDAVLLEREEGTEGLRSIPPIATIAALGPKIIILSSPPAQRRRSSTALPDWWKQCVAEEKQEKLRRSTWHGTTLSTKATASFQRRSLLAKDVSSASVLSGVMSAPPRRNSQVSFVSESTDTVVTEAKAEEEEPKAKLQPRIAPDSEEIHCSVALKTLSAPEPPLVISAKSLIFASPKEGTRIQREPPIQEEEELKVSSTSASSVTCPKSVLKKRPVTLPKVVALPQKSLQFDSPTVKRRSSTVVSLLSGTFPLDDEHSELTVPDFLLYILEDGGLTTFWPSILGVLLVVLAMSVNASWK